QTQSIWHSSLQPQLTPHASRRALTPLGKLQPILKKPSRHPASSCGHFARRASGPPRSREQEKIMNPKAKFALSALAIASLGLVGTSVLVAAEDVPGALAVEWEGKKPCEKLFEDEHI